MKTLIALLTLALANTETPTQPKVTPEKQVQPTPKVETPKKTQITKKIDKKTDKKTIAHKAALLPPLLREIEEKYSKAVTLAADFTQTSHLAALQQTKVSTGTLRVKRPMKLRMEEVSPVPNLLVSNGVTFWYYTPPFDESEKGQVIERKSQEVQSRLANLLLTGSFSLAKDLRYERKGPNEFAFYPRKGTAGTVERALIEVNLQSKLIEKVILENTGGNRSTIQLAKIQLGVALADKEFNFVPPPGTDRMKE